MEKLVLYFIIGVVLLAVVIGGGILFLKRKKQKTETNKEVEVASEQAKENIDELISVSTIIELIEEGEEQVEIGNISEAKKIYKRLLHEYDDLEEKDKVTYERITNLYKKIIKASKK